MCSTAILLELGKGVALGGLAGWGGWGEGGRDAGGSRVVEGGLLRAQGILIFLSDVSTVKSPRDYQTMAGRSSRLSLSSLFERSYKSLVCFLACVASKLWCVTNKTFGSIET